MVVTVGISAPVALTWFGYLPYTAGIIEKVNAYITYPSVFRNYNIRPLPFLIGYAPTVGQSLYIAFFFILNIVVSAVGYKSVQPNTVSSRSISVSSNSFTNTIYSGSQVVAMKFWHMSPTGRV